MSYAFAAKSPSASPFGESDLFAVTATLDGWSHASLPAAAAWRSFAEDMRTLLQGGLAHFLPEAEALIAAHVPAVWPEVRARLIALVTRIAAEELRLRDPRTEHVLRARATRTPLVLRGVDFEIDRVRSGGTVRADVVEVGARGCEIRVCTSIS